MTDFPRQEVWRKAHALVLEVSPGSAGFPSEERVGLTSQLRRAGLSIPANLAEGCARRTDDDLTRFLDDAT